MAHAKDNEGKDWAIIPNADETDQELYMELYYFTMVNSIGRRA